jgi:mono/diheme cytochrome c family protein
MRALPILVAFGLAASGCNDRLNIVPMSPGLERMTRQPRFDPYERTMLFEDERTMRVPPEHSIPFGAPPSQSPVETGRADQRYLERLPIPLTRELVQRGRARFDAICANCHGVLGDGYSAVAMNLQLRRPPSLLVPRPPGRIFEVATDGYGMMPGFAWQLDTTDRWAIVAYIAALQLSAGVSLDSLPQPVAYEARRVLR